jgi:hypothetical protein
MVQVCKHFNTNEVVTKRELRGRVVEAIVRNKVSDAAGIHGYFDCGGQLRT